MTRAFNRVSYQSHRAPSASKHWARSATLAIDRRAPKEDICDVTKLSNSTTGASRERATGQASVKGSARQPVTIGAHNARNNEAFMINITKAIASRANGARKARNPYMAYVKATVAPLRATGSKVASVVLDLEACLSPDERAAVTKLGASASAQLDVMLDTLSSAARNYQYRASKTDCAITVTRTRIRAGKVVLDGTTDDSDTLAYAYTVTRAKSGASASNKARVAGASLVAQAGASASK